MKDSIKKIFDIGSFDLKRTMKFLFWIGAIIIVYSSLRYRNVFGANLFLHSPILNSSGHEAFVSYVKRVDYVGIVANSLRIIMAIAIRLVFFRIGIEFLYIVLNGFKSLGKLEK